MITRKSAIESCPCDIVLLGRFLIMMVVLLASSLLADEKQPVRSNNTVDLKELISQLRSSEYAKRKEAFLELCNPGLALAQNPQDWLLDKRETFDPELSSMLTWITRIRSLPGSIDSKLDAISDFSAISQGSIEVVERYTSQGKLELLLEMIRITPQTAREKILENSIVRGERSIDRIFEKAWEKQRSDLIPKFLDVILPSHPVRIGLNRRWAMLGLEESWKVDVSLDTTAMQIAALESEGQVQQAVQIAKQSIQPGTIEKILLRNQRWDDWLALDPSKLALISAVWSEIPRVLVMEALDRHQEAQQYYQLRKNRASKGVDAQVLLAQLALVTGDLDKVFSDLKQNEPNQLMSMYFLHNRVEQLLDFEGLNARSESSISAWLDRTIVEGKGFSKAVRFQSLFRRLGESRWSDAIESRLIQFIEGHEPIQQIRFWKDYLQQTMRYGLEEKRIELLAKALDRHQEVPRAEFISGQGISGFPEAQEERELTVEDLFREAFPYMKEAAYPLYHAIRTKRLEASQLQVIEWLEAFHQGILPQAWSEQEVMDLYRSAATTKVLQGLTPTGVIIDLAESLEVMGLLEQSVDFLESIRGQVRADLMRSRCYWKAGEFQQSKELVQELLTRGDGGLEVFQWASELLSHLNDQSSHASLERKVLTCSGGMEAFAAYSREMRKGVRFELPESIARFLELQYDCFPSSLGNLWLEDVFWGWNLSLLANHYHQTAPDFPKRVARNFDLSLTSCLFDLFEEFDTSASRNLRASLGRNSVGWDLDWSQWAWRYERVFASGFWQSVQQGDRQKADRFLKSAYRLNPEQINTLIDAVPWVLEKFDRETLKEWFMIYYAPMQEHLRKYPEDSLIANNAAWLAVKCGFEIDRALELSLEVTKRYPTDTYLDTLAEVYFAKGETDRAIEISLACQRLNPRDPHHHRQLSRFRANGSLRR